VSTELVALSESLAAEWDELVDHVRGAPFLRPGWIEAWWRAFGRGTLACLLLRRSGRLAGIVPLLRGRSTVRSPTNAHTPLFGIVAEDGDAVRELVSAMLTDSARRVVLSHIDATDLEPWLRAEANAAGRSLVVTLVQRSPYLCLGAGWAAVEQRLGARRAAEIRRRYRVLDRAGRVSVRIADGSQDRSALLEQGFGLEASAWKGAAGTAIVSRSDTRAFYAAITSWAAARGWLRLAFLCLDERPLAFHLALEQGGVWYLVKGGYDPSFRHVGPGKLLLHEMLRHACNMRSERFEFLGDEESWKAEWATESRPCHLVEAFTRSPFGRVARAATAVYRRWARPLAKRIFKRRRAQEGRAGTVDSYRRRRVRGDVGPGGATTGLISCDQTAMKRRRDADIAPAREGAGDLDVQPCRDARRSHEGCDGSEGVQGIVTKGFVFELEHTVLPDVRERVGDERPRPQHLLHDLFFRRQPLELFHLRHLEAPPRVV